MKESVLIKCPPSWKIKNSDEEERWWKHWFKWNGTKLTRPERDQTAYQDNRAFVLKRDNQKCHYCGGLADQVDHIIPNCYGGNDNQKNLVSSCERCNLLKGCSDFKFFKESAPWLLSKIEQEKYHLKWKYPDPARLIDLSKKINPQGTWRQRHQRTIEHCVALKRASQKRMNYCKHHKPRNACLECSKIEV